MDAFPVTVSDSQLFCPKTRFEGFLSFFWLFVCPFALKFLKYSTVLSLPILQKVLLLLRACSQPSGRVSPQTAISVKTQKIKRNQAHYTEEGVLSSLAVMWPDLSGPASLTLNFYALVGHAGLHIEASSVLSP